MQACCAPAADRDTGERGAGDRPPPRPRQRKPSDVLRGMARVPGGEYLLGSEDADTFPDDAEGPVRAVHLDGFALDTAAVTNRQFAGFVKDTGHVTDAERFGWSFVFYALVHPSARDAMRDGSVPGAPWWAAVDRAYWRAPYGPGSAIGELGNHPVTHVSWHDARAYAAWAGKRLPSEAEWEAAARGGLVGARFPWGDELAPNGRHRCNIWQGRFPEENTAEDGFLGTAPVKSFAPNGYGLHNMSGNVWEWCADPWMASANGATDGSAGSADARVIRGGSYLCHYSYCNRYRVAARTSNTPDSTTGHMGFRCAADIPTEPM